MKSRSGKIARLPRVVREELNQRLECCEGSPQLLAWLNALPPTQALVRAEFGGAPVTKHNLSRWRLGGFQEWLTRRDFYADARNAQEFTVEQNKKPEKALVDQVATVLAARYAGLIVRWDGQCTREVELQTRLLNGMARGVVQLQRETHQAASRPVAVSRSKSCPQSVKF